MFDVLDSSIASGSAVDWLVALISNLNIRIEQTPDVTAKKRLQNHRCQLKRFIEFIADLQETTLSSEVEPGALVLPDSMQYYDMKMLVKKFVSLIISLQSMSRDKNLFFPIHIIGKLCRKADSEQQALFKKLGIVRANGTAIQFRRWFNSWIKLILFNIIFHTTNGDYRLSKIEGLLIDSNRQRAWVRVKSTDVPLLSESSEGMRPMRVSSIKDIHLAYKRSIDEILQHLEPLLINLRLLTDDIKRTVTGQTITIKDHVIALDKFHPRTLLALGNWYCDHVDWTRIAPILSIIRLELGYISAIMRLETIANPNNLKKQ